MKRLDSGEGDVLRFDGSRLKWSNNTGSVAGYWQARGQPPNRGYAHLYEGKTPLTGFFVNTNKTGNPYRIPCQNEELHRLLFDLRVWQEKMNPAVQPIPPELYIDGVELADEGKMDDYPEIFSLFRLPNDLRSGRQSSPPNARRTNEFWQILMAELERRLALENPDGEVAPLVKRQEKTGQAYAAKYNPHGLRVAGLTMMLDQKIPIEVISKLIAGHMTILMTLYYIKFDPATVHQKLDEAGQTRESAEIAACLREVKSADYESAQRRTAVLQPDGLLAATSMDATDKMFWADTGIGFCPWDGTRCHDGGKVLRKSARSDGMDASTYAPVEGGERNCVLCRHFISGPAWRNPQWLYGTKLARQLATKARRVEALNEELKDLLSSRNEANVAARRRLDRDIEARQVEVAAVSTEQEIVAKGMWNTHCLLEACAAIDVTSVTGSGSELGSALVAHSENSVVEYMEVSEFEQAAVLTAAGRIYPILHDDEAEASCNRFIDAVLWHNGAVPLTFAPLEDAAKAKGQDALARLILERVKRAELQALEDGSLKLQDLDLDQEASAVVTAAIGAPLFVLASGRGPGPKRLGSNL